MELISILLYTFIAITTLAIYLIHQRLNYWKKLGIPHEEPQLMSGNLQGLKKKYHIQDIFQRCYKKFKGSGPFCGFYLFQSPVAFVLDLELVRNILIKDFSNFADRPTYYNEKDDPLSAHLIALDVSKWKTMRHKLSPTFTSGKMKFMFPTVLNVGHEFVDVLGKLINEGSTVDVKELFARFTTDVIGTCAFGIDCNSLKDPNAEFRIMGRRSFSEENQNNIVMAFALSYPKLANKLGIIVFPKDVTSFFMQAVRDTIAYRETHSIKRNDFMDMLIELKNNAENKKLPVEERLTVEELAAQAYVFFLAGFETSSTSSSFALYELALHQDVQNRLRTEINEVLAKHEQQFTYECIKDMNYMDQVISETLRMHTIVPVLRRRALVDYPVPGAPKYIIKKGMMVLIPATAIHHDPEIYANPHEFNPDNFSPELVQARDSMSWLAFGDGPRNCIGLRFAQMQSRIGLAMLLQRFKFSVAKETMVPIKIDKTNKLGVSEGGIFLKVEKI